MRLSASIWSRTKLPRAGWAGEGCMLVTIRARRGAERIQRGPPPNDVAGVDVFATASAEFVSAGPSATIQPMVPRPQDPVAVFDSGVGGLTVLHELLVSLPTEDYLYLGDTARFPYRDRSPEELQTFELEISEDLIAAGNNQLAGARQQAQ